MAQDASESPDAAGDVAPRRDQQLHSTEVLQAVQEFTAFVRQLRREKLTDPERAALRSLLEELASRVSACALPR